MAHVRPSLPRAEGNQAASRPTPICHTSFLFPFRSRMASLARAAAANCQDPG